MLRQLIKTQDTGGDRVQRRRAGLLAALLVVLILISLFSAFTTPLYLEAPLTVFESAYFYISLASTVLLVTAFYLNRRGRYPIAAALAIVVTLAGVFAFSLLTGNPINLSFLYYTITPILLASVLLSVRIAAYLSAISLLALTLLPFLVPQLPFKSVPIEFVGINALIIFVVGRFRNRVELDRQAILINQEHYLRMVMDNSHDIISHVDSRGVIRFVSPAVETVIGYPVAGLINRPLREVWADVHPDDYALALRLTETIMKENVSARIVHRYRHSDGRYLWLEAIGRPTPEADSYGHGVIFITRDITERKQMEEALSRSQTQYRAVMEQASEGILITDMDSNYLMANPSACEMLGYTQGELLTMNVRDVLAPGELERLPLQLGRVLDGAAFTNERLLRRKDGTLFTAEVTVKKLDDNRLMGIMRDVTARRQAEDQRIQLAVESERMSVLKRFVDEAASHELRTPLTIMKTSLYLLGRVSDPEKRERYLQNLETQVQHLEQAFENLLNVSQLYEPKLTLHPRALDLNQSVREVLMKQQMLAEQKQQQLDFHPAEDLPQIIGDDNVLQQAIMHLVKNAINFTPAGGRITVQTAAKGMHVLLRVTDNGIGIDQNDLPFIFEPFYRADKARQMRVGEMGLGLSLVKLIADAHHGQVRAESTPDQGSTFTLLLPIHPHPGSEPTPNGQEAGSY